MIEKFTKIPDGGIVRRILPLVDLPISTMILNITSQQAYIKN